MTWYGWKLLTLIFKLDNDMHCVKHWPNISSWNFVLSFYIKPSWYKTTIKNVKFLKNDMNVEKPIAYMYFCHIYIMWPSIIMLILHHCVSICKILLKMFFFFKFLNYICIFLQTIDFDHNYIDTYLYLSILL
jgi:hypothetical protein